VASAEQIEEIYWEAKALEGLDHKNIIKLIKSFIHKKNVIMIMEFCGGGELYEFVKNEGRIDEVDARDIFR